MINVNSQSNTVDGNNLVLNYNDNDVNDTTTATTIDTNYITTTSNVLINNKE